jgi:hypothetical protein
MIFSKFFGGNNKQPAKLLPVVRNITIGRSLILDPLAWRRLVGSHFNLDRDTLEITAQGKIMLEEGRYVHRFYTDDELMFQALSTREDGLDADDFTLFMPWQSLYPSDAADEALFIKRLSNFTWQEEGGPAYHRFWYEGDTRDQPPVELWEAVYFEPDGLPVRHIHQSCMLYSRALEPDGVELLLALAMKPEQGDVTHELMIGLPISPGEFKV